MTRTDKRLRRAGGLPALSHRNSLPAMVPPTARKERGVNRQARERFLSTPIMPRCDSRGYSIRSTSEPSAPLEPDHRKQGARRDDGQPERIAPRPAQLGHELEVHPVNSSYKRRGYADDGDD